MSRASAATAAAELPAPKVRRLPSWTRRNIAWRAIPETYFTVLVHELSPAALALAGLMVCLAGEEEYCDALQSKLAKLLKMHSATVQEALYELERAGAIAKRKVGTRKVYDLLVDQWPKVKCSPRPKVEEMPAAAEAEDAPAPAAEAPRKPLQSVSIARGKTREIAMPAAVTCRAVRCANESAFPIDVEARIIAGGDAAGDTIELAIREKAVIDSSFAANTALKPDKPSQMTGFQELRTMLNRALGAHLGFVPEDDLRAIGAALDSAPIDHLARRLHQRRAMLEGGKGTWGGVLLLARDCAKAFAAASASTPSSPAAAPAPAEPDVSATIARQEAYEAHCEQLFDAWWEAQSAQERAKLAKRHTGVILAQFSGAKLWPAAQLAESVHAAIRAETLKAIAPSFREFAAAKAKGAGA